MDSDENNNTNNVIVKKKLNYNRIKKIVKKTKNLKNEFEESNLKIIKLIFLHYHYKMKRTLKYIFDV